MFPRTFNRLEDYTNSDDKEQFALKFLGLEIDKVEKSFSPELNPQNVNKLYQLSLMRSVGYRDYYRTYGITKSQFLRYFVKTNIFQQLEDGSFKLQYDVTRTAVKSVLGIP
jgi:hypothetical protein